jgi:glutathione S-transferase
MLILYHDWDSLQSMKARMCLEQKGLRYESRIVELTRFEHLRPPYLAVNPQGLVPVLGEGDWSVRESSVINEYLEDRAPSGLRPDDPRLRARMRLWTKVQDEEVHPAIRPVTFQLMIRTRLASLDDDALEALIASHPLPARAAAFRRWARSEVDWDLLDDALTRLARIVRMLDETLATSTWLAGETLSLADIALASFVDRVQHLGLAWLWRDAPAVQRWAGAIESLPSYLAAVCPDSKRLPAPTADTVAEIERRFSRR